MRGIIVIAVVLLAGSLQGAQSPGPAPDPVHASQADLDAYAGVAHEMNARWTDLDADCDPDAVFGLLYLITTAKVGDLVADSHFEDNPLLVEWDMDFAQRYFDAYDAYHAGEPAPEAWQLAFEHADSGNSTVLEDMLLGMSAHVNYDLAWSAYDMGLPRDQRKADYDRVNDAFWNVVVPATDEIGARYDPTFARTSDNATPIDDSIVLMLLSWRENAWQNAQLLYESEGDPIARAFVEAKIEGEARSAAQPFLNDNGDTTAQRQAYCHASGHPPLDSRLGGEGYGDDWHAPHEEHGTMTICHKPGTPAQKTKNVNEHAWKGHENHGDTRGAC